MKSGLWADWIAEDKKEAISSYFARITEVDELLGREIWNGDWKFILNGFDYNEMYNLRDAPAELRNLAGDLNYHNQLSRLMAEVWRIKKEAVDMVLYRSKFPTSRVASVWSNWVETS